MVELVNRPGFLVANAPFNTDENDPLNGSPGTSMAYFINIYTKRVSPLSLFLSLSLFIFSSTLLSAVFSLNF